MIILHKSLGIAAAAEAVAHTDAEDGDRAGLGDDLCHSRAEAAENVEKIYIRMGDDELL